MLHAERARLSRPLTKEERQRALAALESAKKLAAELRECQDGQLYPDSAEIIGEMRDERSQKFQ